MPPIATAAQPNPGSLPTHDVPDPVLVAAVTTAVMTELENEGMFPITTPSPDSMEQLHTLSADAAVEAASQFVASSITGGEQQNSPDPSPLPSAFPGSVSASTIMKISPSTIGLIWSWPYVDFNLLSKSATSHNWSLALGEGTEAPTLIMRSTKKSHQLTSFEDWCHFQSVSVDGHVNGKGYLWGLGYTQVFTNSI